jgi:hypothetical protein
VLTYKPLALPNAAVIGKVNLVFGSDTYAVYIGNITQNGGDNPLAIDMNGDGIIDRAEIYVTTSTGNILDLGAADQSDGGRYTYFWPTWVNTGDTINQSISEFSLLTKKGLFKNELPDQQERVNAIIEKRSNNEIGIHKVLGRQFTLHGNKTFLTYYGICFALFYAGNRSAETLSITYPWLRDGESRNCSV